MCWPSRAKTIFPPMWISPRWRERRQARRRMRVRAGHPRRVPGQSRHRRARRAVDEGQSGTSAEDLIRRHRAADRQSTDGQPCSRCWADFARQLPAASRDFRHEDGLRATNSERAGNRAWLFRPRGRRVARALCLAQLRARLERRSPRRWRRTAGAVATRWRRRPALISLSQVHSPIVHHVHCSPGRSLRSPEGDGMVTATPGLALGILTADCAPVLSCRSRGRRDRRRPCRLERRAWPECWKSLVAAMEKTGREARTHRRRHRSLHLPGELRSRREFRDRVCLERMRGNARFFAPRPAAGRWPFRSCRPMSPHRLTARGAGSVSKLLDRLYPAENGIFQLPPHHPPREADYGRQISAIVLEPVTPFLKPDSQQLRCCSGPAAKARHQSFTGCIAGGTMTDLNGSRGMRLIAGNSNKPAGRRHRPYLELTPSQGRGAPLSPTWKCSSRFRKMSAARTCS